MFKTSPTLQWAESTMLTETELDNVLVKQKDLILSRVNDGAFNEALAMLAVVRELWLANTYEYKYMEITNRIYLTINRNEV